METSANKMPRDKQESNRRISVYSKRLEFPAATSKSLPNHHQHQDDCSSIQVTPSCHCRRSYRSPSYLYRWIYRLLTKRLMVDLPSARAVTCRRHSRRRRWLFCFDCQLVVCAECSVEGHEGHRCVDARKAVDEFRTAIAQNIARLKTLVAECKVRRMSQLGKRQDFMKHFDDVELRILRASGDPKRVIKVIRSGFAALRKTCSGDVEAEIADLDLFINTVSVFSRFCVEVLNRPAVDICAYGSEISNRMKEIRDFIPLLHSTPATAFLKNLSSFKEVDASVKVKSSHRVDGKCSPDAVPAIRGDSVLTTTFIHGVTRWNDDFILLFSRSIAIFRRHPMTRVWTFEISELRYGGDIAINQASGDIFVLERYRGVWKIQTRSTRRFFPPPPRVTLLLRTASHLATLSVAKDDRILLLRDQRPTSFIDLFDEYGDRAASVKLPVFVREPCHALDTPRDTYLVSYGRSRHLVHGVCEVHAAGEELRRFEPVARCQELACPVHLAVDAEGRVLVADRMHHRIVRLDPQLRWERCVVSEARNVVCPDRLQLSFDGRHLFVAYGCKAYDGCCRGADECCVLRLR